MRMRCTIRATGRHVSLRNGMHFIYKTSKAGSCVGRCNGKHVCAVEHRVWFNAMGSTNGRWSMMNGDEMITSTRTRFRTRAKKGVVQKKMGIGLGFSPFFRHCSLLSMRNFSSCLISDASSCVLRNVATLHNPQRRRGRGRGEELGKTYLGQGAAEIRMTRKVSAVNFGIRRLVQPLQSIC